MLFQDPVGDGLDNQEAANFLEVFLVCDPESQFLYIGRLRPNKLWLQLLAVLESSQKVGQFQLHAGWKF